MKQMPFVNAANQSFLVGGTAFAYRDLGPKTAVPLILLNHWGAVLDDFDPRMSMVWRGTGACSPLTIAVSVAQAAPRPSPSRRWPTTSSA
jgi:hypothetical protein